jgi:hypothetical protein
MMMMNGNTMEATINYDCNATTTNDDYKTRTTTLSTQKTMIMDLGLNGRRKLEKRRDGATEKVRGTHVVWVNIISISVTDITHQFQYQTYLPHGSWHHGKHVQL